MNIGSIGSCYSNPWIMSNQTVTNQSEKEFGKVMNEGISQTLELHGLSDQMKSEGYTTVGAWVDARTGNSVSVYRPENFDEKDPKYLVEIWDQQGNVTKREVELSQIDSTKADAYNMFAYSSYLTDSGKYPNAQRDFMSSIPVDSEIGQFGLHEYEDIFTKEVNWFDIIKGWMDMQYRVGNTQGYMDFKGFYDYLSD